MISRFKTSLTSSLVAAGSESTLTIDSVTTKDGQTIAITDFPSGKIRLTINPGGDSAEDIYGTGISGTTITGLVRGLSEKGDDTALTANKKTHNTGDTVIISNPGNFLKNDFVTIGGTQATISGAKTFTGTFTVSGAATLSSTLSLGDDVTFSAGSKTIDMNTGGTVSNLADPSGNQDAATKAYADALTYAGAPDGNATTKGIYELATIAEASASAAAGSGDTSAALTITTALTSNTSGAAQIIPVTDADGDIPVEFMELDADWAFTGDNTHTGTDDFTSSTVTGATPTADTEVAIKSYVDSPTESYTAENLIDEGDSVYISSDGKVKRVSPKAGVKSYAATSPDDGDVSTILKLTDDPDDNSVIFIYWDDNGASGIIHAVVGVLNAAGTDFDYGTVYDSVTISDPGAGWEVCRLSDNKFVFVWQEVGGGTDMKAFILSVSGTTISGAGTEIISTTSNGSTRVGVKRLDDTTFIAGYRQTDAALQVSTVSGTTITPGTVYQHSEGGKSIGLGMFDATNGIMVSDEGGDHYAYLFSLSGAVVTWGNRLLIDASPSSDFADLVILSDTKAVYRWQDGATSIAFTVLTTDGSNVTKGSDLQIGTSEENNNHAMKKVSETMVVATRSEDASTNRWMRFYEITDTGIAGIGDEFLMGVNDADTEHGCDIEELSTGLYVSWCPVAPATPWIITCSHYYGARVGAANADAAKDASVEVTKVGGTASEYTGLTIGDSFVTGNDGRPVVGFLPTEFPFGVATATTDIRLR